MRMKVDRSRAPLKTFATMFFGNVLGAARLASSARTQRPWPMRPTNAFTQDVTRRHGRWELGVFGGRDDVGRPHHVRPRMSLAFSAPIILRARERTRPLDAYLDRPRLALAHRDVLARLRRAAPLQDRHDHDVEHGNQKKI
jgi:hypothetical protein